MRRESGRSTNDDDATEREDRRPEPPDDDARAAVEKAPAAPGSRGPWLAAAALATAVGALSADGTSAHEGWLAATGTLAFLATASGLGDPAKAVIVASTLGALGLALLGAGPSAAGASILFVGVPALAGGIHRLGRLGPDVPPRASTPAPTSQRA
jgi:hypothetical protein